MNVLDENVGFSTVGVYRGLNSRTLEYDQNMLSY